MNTQDTTPTRRRFVVDLTLTFSVTLEAESIEDALEQARESAVIDGTPETVRETVYDAETYRTLLDEKM